jgi:hypothetical protein
MYASKFEKMQSDIDSLDKGNTLMQKDFKHKIEKEGDHRTEQILETINEDKNTVSDKTALL